MVIIKNLSFIVFIFIFSIIIFVLEDKAWVDCSDEKDLYRYVYDGWKVDKILKNGDISYTDAGQISYYKGEEPQIYLSKQDTIKVLNFGWRCWFEMGPELNYKK